LLTVARDGQRLEIPVTPAAAPETVPRDEVQIAGRSPVTGALVANLSPLVATELGHNGLPDGVIIVRVLTGSFADSAGLRRGDVIVSINGTPIGSTQQLLQLAANNPATWEIEVLREGRTLTSSLSIRR
jgi:S1-C subfamily serine protease